MNTPVRPRTIAALSGAILLGSLLTAPISAAESTVDDLCQVETGSLTWGVKQSFRSYISGTIANGSWQTADGATYSTPNFSFPATSGTLDPATGVGTVTFAGNVHFTGHDGVLDLLLANPTIEFEGDGNAALLLDTRSTDMEGELAVDSTQEWVGEIKTDAASAPAAGTYAVSGMPTTLTNSGAAAFGGFYEAGIELDPISVELQLVGCDAVAGAGTPTEQVSAASASESTAAEPASDASIQAAPVTDASANKTPWAPIALGAVAIAVIGFAGGSLVSSRKRNSAGGSEA